MSTLVTSSVRITWSPAPDDGSSDITSYTIKILQSDGATYTEDSTNCDGADQDIMDNLYCDIPMTVFIASPYSLVEDDLIEVIVIATNAIGDSDESDVNTVGILVQTAPQTPTSAPTRNSATTTSSITVDYAAVTQDGGSTILSYSLEWDQGTNTWVSLIGESVHSTSLQHQINTLDEGDSYKFRYRAYNVHGWSAYSAEATILVATVPD